MKEIKGKCAAITGAASGIGRMLALNLASEGCTVAISDIDADGLYETAETVKRKNGHVSTHIVDVGDREQVYQYADAVVGTHGRVDMIVNNAGVVVADTVADVDYDDFNWLFDINFWGVVYGTKAFLPYLKKQPEGHIVNISSVNGFIPFPNNAPYCAAKYAVKGFTEALLQEVENTGIRVSCIHPGGIRTNIVRNARFRKSYENRLSFEESIAAFDRIARTTPDAAAKKIIAGIKKNKRRVLIGWDASFFDVMTRMFPVSFVKWVGMAIKAIK